MVNRLEDAEYKKALIDTWLIVAEKESMKEDHLRLEIRKDDVMKRLNSYFITMISPWVNNDESDNDYNRNVRRQSYNINFRIPIKGTRYQIGFFFDINHEESIYFRIRDYSNQYRNKRNGDNDIFILMDYAEEILDKVKKRSRLSKYKAKYDLSLLIEGLDAIASVRGDRYVFREGTPPVKTLPNVDPMTGRKIKVRGITSPNVGFKISSVITK